ncbi:FTR1 family iron permease [Solibacillus sp. FSL H8-0538]|uniref:FTR1 family iron permease n=1 Tax=Solibacillus sp. FSL H8-0538 TaxID=2921400 RepID=UPI0030F51D92
MNTKQGFETEALADIGKLQELWNAVDSEQTEAKADADAALNEVVTAASADERKAALSNFSKTLAALEKLENPVDEQEQRAEFGTKFSPFMTTFEEALASGELDQVDAAYTTMNVKWNQYERPVREQSIGLYGQIETKLAFLRIALSSENVELADIAIQYADFKETIDSFLSGDEVEVIASDYSLQTLVDYIDTAEEQIKAEDYTSASNTLTEFIIMWPNVEIDVSTRNGSLYTKIEGDFPILVSELRKSSPDVDSVKAQLNYFKKEIQILQEDGDYTFWDSALILLREGLEALLIIMVLVSFLKKSNQEKMVKWIYSGAALGVVLSALAAVLLSVLFQSISVNTSREMLEGYVGLFAAIMMIGIGIWLHNKSSVTSWNSYLSKQLSSAISKKSVLAMAGISFLSVFREGAETILFYVGVAPKMATFDFVLGIIVACLCLLVFAFVLFKLSVKIPVHLFFLAATIFIYVLAFKIIGTSLHTLQLTSVIPTNIIHALPVVSSIGFYPTIETMIGQAILLLICGVVITIKKMKSTAL